MKTTTLKKIILLGLALSVNAIVANAGCSVTKDGYGKSKYVWDFGIEAKDGGATYYLDANGGEAYTTTDPGYGSNRRYYAWTKVQVVASRSIKSTEAPDADKGAGVILGQNQGLIEIYAPVSGILTVTGKYLSNITIADKTLNTTTNSSSATVVSGHRIQIYASGGTGIATMTLTPADWDSDVVNSGTMDFSNTTVFKSADEPGISGYYQISSMGYKSVSGNSAVKDALIAHPIEENTVIIDAAGEYRGLKLRNGSDINFTPSANGILTISYNYNAQNITWYNKGTNTTLGTGCASINLLAGQRAQGCCSNSSNASIRSLTFTASSVTVTVGSTGYSTYVNSNYDLNFTESDIKAYKAKVNTSTVL